MSSQIKFNIIFFLFQVSEAAESASLRHSLRTKRPVVRHVNALKQQEKRRRRNTSVAAETSQSSTSPTLIRTASARKSANSNVGGEFFT
jgi:hypothetical protein